MEGRGLFIKESRRRGPIKSRARDLQVQGSPESLDVRIDIDHTQIFMGYMTRARSREGPGASSIETTERSPPLARQPPKFKARGYRHLLDEGRLELDLVLVPRGLRARALAFGPAHEPP